MQKKTLLLVLSFFSIYVFWGSTYLLNKISVQELPPLMLSSIRFVIAGVLIFIIAKMLGYSLKINQQQFVNSLIAGFLFLGYGNGVMVWSLKHVDSGFAALEASTQPIVILILMRILYGKKIKLKSVIGVILGITGIILLVGQKAMTTDDGRIFWILMIFTCVLSWSAGSLFVAKATLPKNFFIATGYQMFFGGIMLGISSVLFGEQWIAPTEWSPTVIWAIIGLILFGSIAAFTSFNYLLKQVSTEKVATSAYINPIIAVLLGWLVLNENLSLQSIIAAGILLLGVYFINSAKRESKVRTFRS
ncbi:EamA family transporter [Jejudonia soesokkakensis]|uniref:EamA family transporter n=1 Tax=Jejudonia soesokkakensis TaxID=1323432 RepID=A0ABW2MU58_9FLAO